MKARTEITCPYCNTQQNRLVEADTFEKYEVTTCDVEGGGCDKTFVMRITVSIVVETLALVYEVERSEFDDERLREIFRRIAAREDKRGSFLTSFAEMLMNADSTNFALMRSSALQLVSKYRLDAQNIVDVTDDLIHEDAGGVWEDRANRRRTACGFAAAYDKTVGIGEESSVTCEACIAARNQ
jgi:hypothetical protein